MGTNGLPNMNEGDKLMRDCVCKTTKSGRIVQIKQDNIGNKSHLCQTSEISDT